MTADLFESHSIQCVMLPLPPLLLAKLRALWRFVVCRPSQRPPSPRPMARL